MSLSDVFLRPEALGAVLVAPLAWLGLAVLDRARARRRAEAVGPREASRLAPPIDRRRSLRRGLEATALALLALAIARPAFGEGAATERPVANVVVVLDVSRSMLAQDVAPSRLALAQAEVRELSERAVGDRLALVVFAGEARLAVPLTEDTRTVAEVAAVSDPGSVARGGTDLGAAIDAAVAALARGGARAGTVLLASDGEDLEGRGLRAAERARASGVVVHAVGFGTRLGGKIALDARGGGEFLKDRTGRDVVSAFDPASLSRVAAATGGDFVDSSADPHALASLYDRRVRPAARASVAGDETRGRKDRSAWPLLAALLLLAVDLGLSDRRAR